jgi:uncharacterized membrane protein YgcG
MSFHQVVSPFLYSNSFPAVNKIKKSLRNNKLRGGWKAVPIGLLFSLLAFFSSSAFAAEATLAWNPNTESDVEGYGVYLSQDDPGPPYSLFGYVALSELSDSDNPTFTVTGLETGSRYYFAVTAYDTAGNESDFSGSVCADVNGDAITPCASDDTGGGDASGSVGSGTNSGGSSSGGGGGGGCFIGSSAVAVGWLHPGMEALILLCCIAAFAWLLGRKPFATAFIFSRHPKPKNGFDR